MPLRSGSTSYGGLFDVDRKREDIRELEARIAAPGFWDDNETAQKVLKERTAMEKAVEGWDRLSRQAEDARVLIELGAEEEDEETLAEVRRLNDELEQGVVAAEFQR